MGAGTFTKVAMATVSLALLAACGGSGGGGSPSPPPPTTSAKVSGTASKGLIKSGVIRIYGANSDGSKAQLLATTSTDSSGRYNVSIQNYNGPVIIEASGTYLDEATGESKTIDPASPLHAAIASVSTTGVSVAVTPLTDLAYQKALSSAGGSGAATAIANANAYVSTLFGVDITKIQPVDATEAALQGATSAQKSYTLALAAVSQLAKDSNQPISQVISTLKEAGDGAAAKVGKGLANFLAGNTNNTTGYKRIQVALSVAGLSSLRAGALDFTLLLPAGAIVNAETSGALALTEYTVTTGSSTAYAVAKYTAASESLPGMIRMVIVDTSLISNGQVVTLYLYVPGSVQGSGLTVERVTAEDENGFPVAGVTLTAQ